MKALTYVELDIPYCALTYGIAPCNATLTGSPPTGAIKCFNSLATCQDRENFTDQDIEGASPRVATTLRFAVDTDYLPADIWCLPFIASPDDVEITPAIVSLGVNLGQRASVRVKMKDSRYSDTGPGGDKYLSERTYTPFDQGTFFGKFRARHPFLRGRALRVINGELGEMLEDMETRHFVVESFDGPTRDGEYTIVAKDVLKFADGDRAQVPRINTGFLVANISSSVTTATLSPAGVGNLEYEEVGYAAIGGKEIVQFYRDSGAGNDANTVLLVHCDGTDGSGAFTDASASGHAVNNNGDAQIDNGDVIFINGACLLDGIGDYLGVPDHANWTPAGDFTIDLWAKATSLAATRTLVSQHVTTNNEYRFYITTTGAVGFQVVSATVTIIDVISATGQVVAGTAYHLAIQRSGNNFTIFKNGVSIATATDADAIPNFAFGLRIGMRGDTLDPFVGSVDEIRYSHVARYSGTFTPEIVPYQTSSDILQITRAQFNTVAQAHEAEDRVQQCFVHIGADVADIIYDLFINYADVLASWITLSDWQNETAAFLGTLYTGVVGEPTPVEDVIAEMIEQAALAIWWDDVGQQIRLQVLRGIVTEVDRFTEDNTVAETLEIREQPNTRISQVYTYFGKINPLLKEDELSNYRSSALLVDGDAEADYGTPAIKKILSRWIPATGRTIADRLNEIQRGRYRDPPRRFNFEVLRTDVNAPELGRGYRLQAWPLQIDTGAADDVPIQITRMEARADRYKCEAEEMRFQVSATDVANRQIIIDADINNFNFRNAHDSIYPAPVSGITVTCTINAGIIVGSVSSGTFSFIVGDWPAGVTLVINVVGRIQGHGGAGGNYDGVMGGGALYTRYAVTTFYVAGAEVWGGGGGGGGSISGTSGNISGGGGGAGKEPGAKGGTGSGASPGQPGTTEAGGNGASIVGANGGDGGDPGLAGSSGSGGVQNFNGGSPGVAIDGVSFVTVTGSGQDIRGSQIN